jgi:hypothetical protein
MYLIPRIKKEVEEKLIRLSEDFQTMMQSKIDSTTRVTIIENDALKTEVSVTYTRFTIGLMIHRHTPCVSLNHFFHCR